jgi:hypothetical protein
MYRSIKETEIENITEYKREFFKELKKRKIFGKFCLAVAEAFAPTDTTDVFGERIYKKHPHDDAEYYIAHSTRIDARFLNAVKKEWKIGSHILIQP